MVKFIGMFLMMSMFMGMVMSRLNVFDLRMLLRFVVLLLLVVEWMLMSVLGRFVVVVMIVMFVRNVGMLNVVLSDLMFLISCLMLMRMMRRLLRSCVYLWLMLLVMLVFLVLCFDMFCYWMNR